LYCSVIAILLALLAKVRTVAMSTLESSISAAIAETVRFTYLLSASVAYQHTVKQCADLQDLQITSK